jgi:release factor glutamine methyltransferase
VTVRWRQLRHESLKRLRAAGIEDAEPELRWIIEQATGRSAPEQAAVADTDVTPRQLQAVHRMVARRAAGEPLQYVLGRWGFRTLDLLVDHRVLIPRPETEVVAGLAVDALATLGREGVAVDLGTGCGAIALSLAAERWPHVEVWAADASPEALAVARANLAGLGRRAAAVRLVEGDWFAALPSDLRGRVDVVVANPPYVAAADPLPAEVAEWEPLSALVAGATGLEAVERIVGDATGWLSADGVLIVEIGDTQGDAAQALARAAGFGRVEVEPDLTGRDRAVVARG